MKFQTEYNDILRTCLGVLFFLVLSFCLVNVSEGTVKDEYVGSETCGECHEGEHVFWQRTLHSRIVKTAEQEQNNSDIFTSPDFPYSKNSVALVVGNVKKQVFLRKGPRYYHFLPKQYNIREKIWEPFRISEWEPSMRDEDAYYQENYNWNKLCAPCHTTGYNFEDDTFMELAVGCEKCHGPGKSHSRTGDKNDIINPRSLTPQFANYICAQCHSRGNDKNTGKPFPVNYQPGDDLHDQLEFVNPILGKNTTFFWGNGMARKHHEQYLEFMQSEHFKNGLACIDCHEPHRLRLSKSSSLSSNLAQQTKRFYLAQSTHSACIKCHTDRESEFLDAADVYRITGEKLNVSSKTYDKHHFHPLVIEKTKTKIDKNGERDVLKYSSKILCNDCHMPVTAPVNMSYNMHTHTFRVPDPSSTLLYGVQNACNNCHSSKSPEWALKKFHTMWAWRRPSLITEEYENLNKFKSHLDEFLESAPHEVKNDFEKVTVGFNQVAEIYSELAPVISELESKIPSQRENNGTFLENIGKYSDAFCFVAQQITNFRTRNMNSFGFAIDTRSLDACNYLCDILSVPRMELPELQNYYNDSMQQYKDFNQQIIDKGNSFFKDKKTTFTQWVNIYSKLLETEYSQKLQVPDYILKELCDMGLLKFELFH